MPDYSFIDVWSSSATWGGGPKPIAGDLVVVGEGETLLIDEDTAVIKMLLINGRCAELVQPHRIIELRLCSPKCYRQTLTI